MKVRLKHVFSRESEFYYDDAAIKGICWLRRWNIISILDGTKVPAVKKFGRLLIHLVSRFLWFRVTVNKRCRKHSGISDA